MNDMEKALEKFREAETLMWAYLIILPCWAEWHIN